MTFDRKEYYRLRNKMASERNKMLKEMPVDDLIYLVESLIEEMPRKPGPRRFTDEEREYKKIERYAKRREKYRLDKEYREKILAKNREYSKTHRSKINLRRNKRIHNGI